MSVCKSGLTGSIFISNYHTVLYNIDVSAVHVDVCVDVFLYRDCAGLRFLSYSLDQCDTVCRSWEPGP